MLLLTIQADDKRIPVAKQDMRGDGIKSSFHIT